MKSPIACLVFILVTGCAHNLTKSECARKDPFKLGKSLAYKGFKSSILNNIQKSCKEHGVEFKSTAFKKGWREGMKDFCTDHRGFHWGVTRREDPKICIEELRLDFEKGYIRGKNLAKSRGRKKKL